MALPMSNLKNILRFGWPYLRRYRSRLVAGVLLGLFFALTNGLILQAASLVMDRLRSPSEQSIALRDLQMKAEVEEAEKSTRLAALPSGSRQMADTWKIWKQRQKVWRKQTLNGLDRWLPMAGRKMDQNQMVGVLLIFPLLMGLRGYTGYLSSYCLGWVSERVINDLQVDVLKKLHSLSLDYFNKSQLGDLTTRVQSDTAWLQRALNLGLSDLVKEPSTVLVIFVILLWLDLKMTLFVLLVMPICLIPVIVLGRKIRHAAKRGVETKVSQSSQLLEVLAGIRVVKAFGLEAHQTERFREHAQDLVRFGMKGVKAKELVNPIIETITALIFGVLLVFLFRNGRSPEQIIIFVGGLVAAFTPLKKIAGLHVLFAQSSAGVNRLAQILDEQPTVREPAQPLMLPAFQRAIAFEGVSFGYGDKPVLRNVTLQIPAGQRVGIAGESGSGKSTLLNLLFRFYDPTQGRICLDGADLRSIRTGDLRHEMALVSQEIVLFDQSIAENIACGKLHATREEIVVAAKAAFAHDFIQALPRGYDTRIGERGVTLSGGQRQRLAIARAFVRNAPILVLDEATASLDSQSESEVQASIDALAERRTVICVAHRLSTLAKMDRVLVLEKGLVVEDGTFAGLLQSNGRFAAMARKQGMA